MEDKFFNVDDEIMLDYAEMTSFDFGSRAFSAHVAQKGEYSHQQYTFKYGNFDMIDMFKSMFTKATAEKC